MSRLADLRIVAALARRGSLGPDAVPLEGGMKSRVDLKCACGWVTSRSPRADGDYGNCQRCEAALRLTPRRVLFGRKMKQWQQPQESR